MLGRVLKMNLGKKVGDDVAIAGEPFRVIGIFESDSLFENGGLIVPLRELQRMMGRQGQVTGFVVAAKSAGAGLCRGPGAIGSRRRSRAWRPSRRGITSRATCRSA